MCVHDVVFCPGMTLDGAILGRLCWTDVSDTDRFPGPKLPKVV